MDFGPIGQAVGAIGLAGGLILALLRYLTSDAGYRDLINEQRREIDDLRQRLNRAEDALSAIREGRIPPPPQPGEGP